MGRVDFNTILISSLSFSSGIEIRETQESRCEALQPRCSVTLSRQKLEEREKFGMCEDRDKPNTLCLGIDLTSKGPDDGSVVGTEIPVFSPHPAARTSC
jgi:hypothetical protein